MLPSGVHSHLSKRCVSVRRGERNAGRAVLLFADGSTHEADVVIGADGIKSAVRTQSEAACRPFRDDSDWSDT